MRAVGRSPAGVELARAGGNPRGVVGAALKDALPLAVSVFVYGTVFGVTSRNAGLTPAETGLMSAFVFAGAAQFAAVSLWSAGASALQIVLTAFVVNLRYLLMGASMARLLSERQGRPLPRTALAALAAGLSDESYAVSARRFSAHGPSGRYLLVANSLLYVTWLSSSLLGAFFGALVARPERFGLDFAFPAAFLAILLPQLKTRPAVVAAAAAAMTSVLVALYVPGNWYLLTAILAAALAGAGVERNRRR